MNITLSVTWNMTIIFDLPYLFTFVDMAIATNTRKRNFLDLIIVCDIKIFTKKLMINWQFT